MRKDLTVEFRSREILSTTLFFALSAVLVFAVALVKEGRTVVDAGTSEELSAPYASNAAFKFFVGSALTAQAAAPANLSTLRGIELNMTGMSEKKPRQAIAEAPAPFVTAVFFKNRLN